MKRYSLVLFSLIILGVLLSINYALAYDKDIAYVVENQWAAQTGITSAITEMGLTYQLIYNANLSTTNFSKYRAMVVNKDWFMTSYNLIPVNNVPAVIVNGDNMRDWGWCSAVTQTGSLNNMQILLAHKITEGISATNITAYTGSNLGYYIQQNNLFSNITTVVSRQGDPTDVVIAYAEKGRTLKKGSSITYVNARTVFFGVTESNSWTNNTRKLFKNSIVYVLGEEKTSLNIGEGANLISIPLLIEPINVSALMSDNPQITSVKTYNNNTGMIVNATTIENQKAYFISSNSGFALNLTGGVPLGSQTLNINSGMNLVGFNILANKSFASLNIPSSVKEIARRNSDGTYNIATKYTGGWVNAFDIEPGRGYWIKSSSATTWTYNP